MLVIPEGGNTCQVSCFVLVISLHDCVELESSMQKISVLNSQKLHEIVSTETY